MPERSNADMQIKVFRVETPQLATAVRLIALLMPPAEAENGTVRLKPYEVVLV